MAKPRPSSENIACAALTDVPLALKQRENITDTPHLDREERLWLYSAQQQQQQHGERGQRGQRGQPDTHSPVEAPCIGAQST
uniref:Uncharacterized protein n=1 Tax=Knipowitschia caucasica TaxID=637954 RepID=A0AAV2IY63_KNICA